MKNKKRKNFFEWNRKIRVFANRKYKDRLFQRVFADKRDLLELYNAINHTFYSKPDELIITTIDDAIYMSMKNDKSFIISSTLNLYEHQSTMNPNMPIRGLLYFARLYETYIEENGLDVYGSKLIKLPLPQYIVFYNGGDVYPEELTLSLTDAFEQKDDGKWISALECKARVININYGHNEELMKKCSMLMQYAMFVQTVRDYQEKGFNLLHAIDQAIEDCIENGVLKDILIESRGAVRQMLLTEYNEKLHNKTLREEGIEIGIERGIERGIEQGKVSIVFEMVRDGDITSQRGAQKLSMTAEEFSKKYNEYLKK